LTALYNREGRTVTKKKILLMKNINVNRKNRRLGVKDWNNKDEITASTIYRY
jgi:hypothetical protein